MRISSHKTRSVFDRHNTVNESDRHPVSKKGLSESPGTLPTYLPSRQTNPRAAENRLGQ
jgi:hypothetical protein